MEYATERRLEDIAPLLERMDRGDTLTAEEQTELSVIRALDGHGWEGELPRAIRTLKTLEFLDLNGTKISDLTSLSGLLSLVSLQLCFAEVSDLTPLSGLVALESLHLNYTKVNDLYPLSGLKALKSVELEGTKVSDLNPLADFKAFESLNLRGTLVSDLIPLSGLTSLKSLDLCDTRVSNLSPLRGLQGLEYLGLGHTQVSELTPLSNQVALKSLDLSGTRVSDLNPLSDLRGLESLELVATQVSDLTPLGNLNALKSLDLRGNRVNDLTPLSNLVALKSLNLSGTLVNDLGPLSGLLNLESLGLGYTQVSDLSPLGNLKSLKSLKLRFTKIRDLTPLIDLEQLEALELINCNIRAIPATLYKSLHLNWAYPSRKGIHLLSTTLSTQPISIFKESDEVIRAYYDAPKKAVRESKVIFLGDGGAGKTHTIKRILKDGSDEDIGTDVTLGISIQSFTVNKEKENEFKINFWDFGGQENMHAMHRCFLTERTLYVVVINNRWDLDQQARYWLDNIRSFAPDSPVILAVNLWEGIHKYGLDTNRLHRDYPNLVEVQPYAAKGADNGNFTALTNLIVQEAEKLDSCAMELPVEWAAIRQELIDKANSDKWYMDREGYHEICEKHGLGEEQSSIRAWLLEWFNDLGICFSYHRDKQTKEELGTYKVLNPKWLTSAIYILLNHADLDVDNGCITHSEIRKTLKHPLDDEELNRKDQCDYILPNVKYSPQECEYILQVMRKFGLSYQIVGRKKEFIPALCDSQMPKDLHPTGWGTPISYEFRYSFLPDSVVQRMMIRLYGSKNFIKLWRRGFRFDEPDHGLITVVDAGGPNDILRIDVYSNKENKGRDVMMGLITNIAAVNAELNLKPEQYIIVHADRGEIAASADMILQAKEKGYTNLPLYSKENGLVEKNVDEILGCTYGRQIIEAAQLVAKDDRRRLSEAVPQIINNYYVYGNIYNSSTPDGLLDLLEQMIEQNIQVSSGFIEYLLEQLHGSEDENAKELADDLKKEKGEGFLKKLSKGIKALTGLVTDGKAAYDAAKPIIEAVKLALLTQGPKIAEGAMEFFNLLPPG